MTVDVTPRGTRGAKAPPSGALGRAMMRVARFVHRRTGNKMSGVPLLYLTTVGAKSGQRRTAAVMSFPEGDHAWLIVASRGGTANHPSWFYRSTPRYVSSSSRGTAACGSERREARGGARPHAGQVADTALGEAASAMLESTGEPGPGAAAAGTMMSESELQRIIDRAGLTSAPADLHALAYRDRHG